MAGELVEKRTALEFVVTVVAIIIGLVLGKYLSKALAGVGVPIAAGNPVPVTLPGSPKLPYGV